MKKEKIGKRIQEMYDKDGIRGITEHAQRKRGKRNLIIMGICKICWKSLFVDRSELLVFC